MYLGILKYFALIFLAAQFVTPVSAQRGDRGDERAKMKLPDHIKVPPAPVVPPDKAIGTFQLKEGFKIELVAAEPLVDAYPDSDLHPSDRPDRRSLFSAGLGV